MISKNDFDRLRNELEKSNTFKCKLKYGNTQDQRYNFIYQHIKSFCDKYMNDNKIHIVDIGCGEGFYIKKLLKELNSMKDLDLTYHAHDIEPVEMDKIDKLREGDDMYKSVQVHRNLDQVIETLNKINEKSKITIIMSEVIEHIDPLELRSFLTKIVNNINFDQLIITTPHVDFNQYYLLGDGEFRHNDHKHEFNKHEFMNFMHSVCASCNKKVNYIYYKVGDIVDNVSTTQGIILNTI